VKDIYREYILDFCFAALPLSFFFPLRVFNVILIATLSCVAILLVMRKTSPWSWRLLFMLLVPFLLLLCGVMIDIFQGTARESFHELESFLPLLFMALIIFFVGVNDRRIQLSKYSFFGGSVLTLLVCVVFAFWKNATLHDEIVYNWNFEETMKFYEDNPIGVINWGYFLYSEFAVSARFHPVYLATYFATAILFGISFLIRPQSRTSRIVIVASMFFLALGIFLLSGRMPIVILALIVLASVAYFILMRTTRRNWWKVAVAVAVLVIIPFLMPVTLYRIQSGIKVMTDPVENFESPYNNMYRVVMWRNSVQLAAEKLWTGYGLYGGESRSDAFVPPEERARYNTHNQYLMILLTIGIFGLLAFIAWHGGLMHAAFKRKDYLYLSFLIIMLLAMLTENFISRHRGVILYAWFNALFFTNLQLKRNEKV
jgi:hypothetical protein